MYIMFSTVHISVFYAKAQNTSTLINAIALISGILKKNWIHFNYIWNYLWFNSDFTKKIIEFYSDVIKQSKNLLIVEVLREYRSVADNFIKGGPSTALQGAHSIHASLFPYIINPIFPANPLFGAAYTYVYFCILLNMLNFASYAEILIVYANFFLIEIKFFFDIIYHYDRCVLFIYLFINCFDLS